MEKLHQSMRVHQCVIKLLLCSYSVQTTSEKMNVMVVTAIAFANQMLLTTAPASKLLIRVLGCTGSRNSVRVHYKK